MGRVSDRRVESDLLTLSETANRLRISMPTLYRLLAAGALVKVKIGRRAFVERAEIARFVAAHRTSRGSP